MLLITYHFNISVATVLRTLNKAGIHHFTPASKELLSAANIAARMAFLINSRMFDIFLITSWTICVNMTIVPRYLDQINLNTDIILKLSTYHLYIWNNNSLLFFYRRDISWHPWGGIIPFSEGFTSWSWSNLYLPGKLSCL